MVEVGEKYRHYKGKIVEIVATSIAPSDVIAGSEGPWINTFATDDILKGEKVIIYCELNGNDEILWVRPLRIFEEAVSRNNQLCRFEKIL